MRFNKFRKLAVIGTAALAIGYMSNTASAADNANVNASITTSSTITAAAVNTMDFGTWLVGIHTGDTPTIRMDATGAYTTGSLGTSQIANLGAGTGTPGSATITLPNGADGVIVQMSLDAINDFAGGALSLTAVTYDTATEAETAIVAGGATQPVTNVNGSTPETISFGATITASATPTDGNHTASLDISFDY